MVTQHVSPLFFWINNVPLPTPNHKYNIHKIWRAVFWNYSLWFGVKRQAYDFFVNGVLLPIPRSQVTIFNKHEELFFEIVPCDSELNGRLTTSFLNGVPEVASSKNKPEFHKNLRSNFRKFLLISWSWPLLSQPLFLIIILKG